MPVNPVRLGDWQAVCDRCGRNFLASQLLQTWDGLWVCKKDWEPRHPQEYLKGRQDSQAVPWVRKPPDNFVAVPGATPTLSPPTVEFNQQGDTIAKSGQLWMPGPPESQSITTQFEWDLEPPVDDVFATSIPFGNLTFPFTLIQTVTGSTFFGPFNVTASSYISSPPMPILLRNRMPVIDLTASLLMDSELVFTGSGSYVYSGAISGNYGLTLDSPNLVLTLSGYNNYAGVTTVNAGTLVLTTPNSASTEGILVNAGGTLDITALSLTDQFLITSRLVLNVGGALKRSLLPTDLAGAEGWYRTTLSTDFVLDPTNALNIWKDLSGSGRDQVQTTVVNMPTIDLSTGWFKFDGTHYTTVASPFSSREFAVVGMLFHPLSRTISLNDGAGIQLRPAQFPVTSRVGASVAGTNYSSALTVPNSTAYLLSYRKFFADNFIRAVLNGGNEFLINITTATPAMSFSGIGLNTVLGYFLTPELIVSSDVSPSAVRRLEGYLAWAKGFQANLSSTHPYAAAAPWGIQLDTTFTPGN